MRKCVKSIPWQSQTVPAEDHPLAQEPLDDETKAVPAEAVGHRALVQIAQAAPPNESPHQWG